MDRYVSIFSHNSHPVLSFLISLEFTATPALTQILVQTQHLMSENPQNPTPALVLNSSKFHLIPFNPNQEDLSPVPNLQRLVIGCW